MDELNSWGHQHATDQQQKLLAQDIVEQVFDAVRPQLVGAVQAFLAMPISATALHQFELALVLLVREIGRLVLQAAVQMLEPTNIHGGTWETTYGASLLENVASIRTYLPAATINHQIAA